MKWFQSLQKWLFFNREYLHHPRWETGITPPELIDYAQFHKPGKVLDVGCGTGLNSFYLARLNWTVDAVDFSPLAIRLARRRVHTSADTIHFMVGNAARLNSLPLRKPYDLILDIGCLHALGDEQSAREYAHSIPALLKPGGDFLLYAHMPDQAAEGFPSHGLDLSWINNLFTPDLNILEYRPGEERDQNPARLSAWYFLSKPA